MASISLTSQLGPLKLRTPLIAASGTVGSVWEWAEVADPTPYGAAVAKSVSHEPWEGRAAPRIAPAGTGMLNGIGIQNPGIEAWSESMISRVETLPVPVWGSAVGHEAEEFAIVAKGLEATGVPAVEVNLSCPNLDGILISLNPKMSAAVIDAVVRAVSVPVGAKLSPNSEDIVAVATATREAGASFLTLTNTAWGFGVDISTGRPKLSGAIGGYSGPGLKAIALRCVYEVASAMPDTPIVGCGGVRTGEDVVEYLMAGASAVGVGTVHLAEPKAGSRIQKEMIRWMRKNGVGDLESLIGRALR